MERRKSMDSSSLLQILYGLQSIRWTKRCSEFVTEALAVHQLLGFVFVPESQLWMGRRRVCQLAVQQQTFPKTLETFCDGILGGGWVCTEEMFHTIPLDSAAMNSYGLFGSRGAWVREFSFCLKKKIAWALFNV